MSGSWYSKYDTDCLEESRKANKNDKDFGKNFLKRNIETIVFAWSEGKKSDWENYESSNITKRTVAKGKEFFSVSVADESVN